MQIPDVLLQLLHLVNHHPPLYSPQNRRLPVVREIDAGASPQHLENAVQRGSFRRRNRSSDVDRSSRVRQPCDSHQFARDLFWRQNVIDRPRTHRAARHVVVLRRRIVLRERHSALRLYLRDPQRPVRARARQHDPDRVVAVLLRHRSHELIDRHVYASRLLARVQSQRPLRNRHRRVRWNHIDVIAFDRHPVFDFRHSASSFASTADPSRMLWCFGSRCCTSTNESPVSVGDVFQQFGGRFDAAGGGPNGNHHKLLTDNRRRFAIRRRCRFRVLRLRRIFIAGFLFRHIDSLFARAVPIYMLGPMFRAPHPGDGWYIANSRSCGL